MPQSWAPHKIAWCKTTASGTTPPSGNERFYSDDEGTYWITSADLREAEIYGSDRRVTNEALREHSALKIFPANSVLVAMYGATVGRLGLLKVAAATNQACCAIFGGNELDQRFLYWWLSAARADLLQSAYGSGQPNISQELIRELRVPAPTLDTQRAIADYLDTETARIDALIAKKRRMIDLLEERFEAWIRIRLGTLNKFSQPLKRGWKVTDCKHTTPTYVDDGYPVVSPGDATAGRLDLRRCHRFVNRFDLDNLAAGERRPKRGDIIYSRNASIGIASYVDTDDEFCMGQDVCLITSQRQDQLYLSYALNSVGIDQLDVQKLGSTFSRINVAQILELKIPLPDPDVQVQLAAEFDTAKQHQSIAAEAIQRQLDLLAERRQALITAAVTGELKILGVAA